MLGWAKCRRVSATRRGSECVSRHRRRIRCHKVLDKATDQKLVQNQGIRHRVQENDRRRAAPTVHAAAKGISTTPVARAPRSREARRSLARRRASTERACLARPLVLAGRSRRRTTPYAIAAKLIRATGSASHEGGSASGSHPSPDAASPVLNLFCVLDSGRGRPRRSLHGARPGF